MPSLSHSSVPLPRTNMICGGPKTGMNGQAARSISSKAWVVVMVVRSPFGRDHRPDAGVGEDLEQQHVGDAAVEDVGAADAVAHGLDAAGDLRDHPAGDRAVGDQRLELVGGRLADQAGRVVDVAAQALDVGEVDELLGAERLGDGAGDDVGVDVVGLAGLVGADRGDDRDELVGEQAVEDRPG